MKEIMGKVNKLKQIEPLEQVKQQYKKSNQPNNMTI